VNDSKFADLTGYYAVVTGSSKGIGRAIALEFARGGAEVVIHCRQSQEAAESLAEEIHHLGTASRIQMADLSDETQLAEFVEQSWNCFGNIDIWINNAGADLLTGDATGLDYQQKLQRLLDVDVRSTLLLSRFIGKKMVEQGSGVILNIGWDQSDRGMEGDSGELFAASKNAIMGFTRSLAVSLAPKVRVNCIAPGWIRTGWGEQAPQHWQQRVQRETPLKRWGMPQDVANMARFLSSTDAAYITGQVINVNGGAVR
jgi:3-oxoacyl-[acyl-carrier protein] reductase